MARAARQQSEVLLTFIDRFSFHHSAWWIYCMVEMKNVSRFCTLLFSLDFMNKSVFELFPIPFQLRIRQNGAKFKECLKTLYSMDMIRLKRSREKLSLLIIV